MIRAVIFDFYGTLAHWRYQGASHYTEVFADHGYELPEEVVRAYVARFDGMEHGQHSADREAYEDWVRFRLRDLTGACAVAPTHEVPINSCLA